jgi:acyl carrier protein
LDTIEEQVFHIVAAVTKVPASNLSLDTDLRTELNVDSLQGLQIVAALETQFDITVPDDELDFYTSIRSIAQTVRRLSTSAQTEPPH